MEKLLRYAVLILLGFVGWLGYKLATQQPQIQYVVKPTEKLIDEAKVEAKKLAQSVDERGFSKTAFELKKQIIGNGDISKLPVSPEVYDSLRLDNIDKGAKLVQASALMAKAEAKNLRLAKKIDSLTKRESLVYTDDYLTAVVTQDSAGAKLDASWRIKLIRHDTKKRKWLLAPYTYQTEILSPDNRVSIEGLQNLSINSQKPTRWGLGLQGGYYYDPSQNKLLPALGFGISYNLIRF